VRALKTEMIAPVTLSYPATSRDIPRYPATREYNSYGLIIRRSLVRVLPSFKDQVTAGPRITLIGVPITCCGEFPFCIKKLRQYNGDAPSIGWSDRDVRVAPERLTTNKEMTDVE
jgi:hypothetical protein